MTAKKKFYGKDFQEKIEKLKGAHKGVELTTGNRLPHGYEIVKGADKNKDYSKGKKKIVVLKKGHRLAHGYVATKGAKMKKYEEGGGVEYNDTFMFDELYNTLMKSGFEKFKKDDWAHFDIEKSNQTKEPLLKKSNNGVFVFDNSGFYFYPDNGGQASAIYMNYEYGDKFATDDEVVNENNGGIDFKNESDDVKTISANDFFKMLKKGDKITISGGFNNIVRDDVVVEDVQIGENNNKIVRLKGVGFGAIIDNVRYTMERFLQNTNIIEYNNKKVKISKKFATGGGVGEKTYGIIERFNHKGWDIKHFIDKSYNEDYWYFVYDSTPFEYETKEQAIKSLDSLIKTNKYATGGGVGYEILDDLKYESFGKGGNMTNDEKLFCDSIKNRFVEKENPTKAELKKAIEENMDSFSDEGKAIAKSVLSKI